MSNYQDQLKVIKEGLEKEGDTKIPQTIFGALIHKNFALKNESKQLKMAIDAGSTATRIAEFEMRENFKSTPMYSTPSKLGIHMPSGKSVKMEGDKLYDNMYIKITGDKAVEPIHLMLGGIREREICNEVMLSSIDSKASSEVTHLNTIGNIALIIVNNIMEGKECHAEYEIKTYVSLRPKDINNDELVADYKKLIADTYKIEYPFADLEFKITIKEDDISIMGEPTANMVYTRSLYKKHNLENLLLIDGGGSSIDGVLSKGKQIFASKSDNETEGGEDIQLSYVQLAESNLKFSLSQDQIRQMLSKGVIIRNGIKYDCKKLVSMMNTRIAKTVINIAAKQLQLHKLTLNALDGLCVTGRLFQSELDDETLRPFPQLKAKLQQYNKDMLVLYNDDEFAIVKGLIMLSGK